MLDCIHQTRLLPMLPSSTKTSLEVFGLSTSQGYGNGEVGVEKDHNGLCREL